MIIVGLFSSSGINTTLAQAPPILSENFELVVGTQTYPIEYGISSGNISRIIFDESLRTITISLENTDNARFEIVFPRNLMLDLFSASESDAYYNSVEVFTDSISAEPEIVYADCEAVTFRLDIVSGTEEIEFVGTHSPADIPILTSSSVAEHYSFFHTSTYAIREYYGIWVSTNADSCDITMDTSEKKLSIVTTSSSEDPRYLGLQLPHSVLGANYTVLVDGIPMEYNSSFVPGSRASHFEEDSTTISLEYAITNETSTTIEVIGTSVIPEFQAFPYILLLGTGIALVFTGHYFRAGNFLRKGQAPT